ncbi:hypothetical protein Bca4012_065990 [Brassica carinata]|uniref:Uncharacterized protein n=1 Tax=Brassica carinata TaxID=52824 RepID=A0A8X7VNN0_BRACI|nr:hypothetical protein Bca52824_018305 [Brassica carinata]
MLKQDDPKAKEDVSSSVGGEETAIYKFSEEAIMDEANPSTIDKSLAPGTEQSPRYADESEEDKNNEDKDVREEHKEPGEVEKDAKEGGAEMEVVQMESRNNEEGENPEGEERTTQSVGEPETELHDVSSFLEKCNGVVPTSWVFTSFPIPLEAIPTSGNHFRESVNGARPGCPRMCKMQYKRKGGTKAFSLNAVNVNDIEIILVATEAEKELLESIGMGKESCWADDDDDAEVDRWTKIIRNEKQVIFEAEFSIDFETRRAQVEGPTIPAIGEPSNNADSGEAHADSVEAPGAEALKAMEARLMNAFQDAMKVLKDEVKSLRARVDGKSGDNPSDQVRVSDKDSEEDGDDKESEEEDGGDKDSEEEEGGDKDSEEEDGGDNESEEDVDDYILDISNQVQLEHGSGDDDMDETLVRYAAAEDSKKAKTEKTKSVKNKKKRERTDDGKEVVPSKKAKGCDTVRSPIGTRRHKLEEEAAQKMTRYEKKKAAAAEKVGEKKQLRRQLKRSRRRRQPRRRQPRRRQPRRRQPRRRQRREVRRGCKIPYVVDFYIFG